MSVIPFPLPGKLFCILQFYSNAPVARNIGYASNVLSVLFVCDFAV